MSFTHLPYTLKIEGYATYPEGFLLVVTLSDMCRDLFTIRTDTAAGFSEKSERNGDKEGIYL